MAAAPASASTISCWRSPPSSHDQALCSVVVCNLHDGLWHRIPSITSFPVTHHGVRRCRHPSLDLSSRASSSESPSLFRPWTDDLEEILWSKEEIADRVSELAAEISEEASGSDAEFVVVGVAIGAFVFLADLVRGMRVPMAVDLIRVESYGVRAESSGAPAIVNDVRIDVKGKHVFLVEDIIDTGNTLSFLISHMKSKGACSVSVCTFLDKPGRRKVHFELVGDGKFYRGFECPDRFVVGYGMDFSERYRNLPFVGALKPEKYTS